MSKQPRERARSAAAPLAPRGNDPAQLRQTLADVGDFIAMLSHELRQPLAAAIAAIEIQKQSPRADRQEKARCVIEQQVRHIARLVGDLSEVSRLSRAMPELRRERLELRELISETLAMTEALFDERRHQVTAALGNDPVWVQGDATRLKQVFSNLLRNAATYTPPGGAIRLSLEQSALSVCFRIADNGVGIPPETIGRIFELFQRGPYGSDGQSAGIGLAVVRRLVELHGGSVTAASDGLGRGSEFAVVFPRDTCN